MQDAGGEDNPEAFAEFLATMEFHRALALDKQHPVEESSSSSDDDLDETTSE